MLRPHDFALCPTGFALGRGAMAKLIAEFDWARHPFGPIESWPQSLRSTLGICLQSRVPTAIYWGPELRLLYNDAWVPIPGPRHPGALGARAQDVWADIWHEIGPQFRFVVTSGEGMFVEDRFLPMARYGAPEETYWSYSFTPICGEDGRVAGVFNSGSETTNAVLAQRQMRFFLDLGDLLRAATDLDTGRRAVLKAVGEHLGVAAVIFADVADEVKPRIIANWSDRAMDPAAAVNVLVAAGRRLRAGGEINIVDGAADLSALGGAARLAGWDAILAVPMSRAGIATALVIALERPRAWNRFDCATLREVLERLEVFRELSLSRERQEMVVREVDHRARNAMTVAQSIVNLTFAEGGAHVRENVRERLEALGRSQDLLSKERWQSLDFATLIAQELAPFPHVNAKSEGPSVPLPPGLAQTLSLLVHELATNSVKYGVMGLAGGEVSISWRLKDGFLEMDWRERLPEESAVPSAPGAGFGTTLMERIVRSQLRGSLERRFDARGFSCTLKVPFVLG